MPADPELWLKLLHLTLAAVVPTALLTCLLCWFFWGRRRAGSGHARGAGRGSADFSQLQEQRRQDQRRIEELEEELTAVEQRHREPKHDLIQTKRALDEAMDKIEALRQERDQLQRAAGEMGSERERLQALEEELGSSRDEISELKEALRESEYRVSRLGTEIQLLRTVRTEFEALRNDNTDLEDDLNTLRVEKSDLEEQVGDLLLEVEEAREMLRRAERDLLHLREAKAAPPPPVADSAKSEEQLPAAPASSEASEGKFGQIYEMPPSHVDDLTRIEGLSSILENKLNELGIYRFSQIASWQPEQIAAISERLGFQDRIVRDRWVEQAARLQHSGAALDAQEPREDEPDNEDESDNEEAPDGDDAPDNEDAPGDSSNEQKESPDAGNVSVQPENDSAVRQPASGPRAVSNAAAPRTSENEGGLGQSLLFFDEKGDPLEASHAEPDSSETETAPEQRLTDVSESEELLIHDPSLGSLYRRPPSEIDDLTQIKGIARVIEGRLHEIGIFRYRQIAAWTDDQVEAFAKQLSFRDRIERDRWREQCQDLHEEKYGESVPGNPSQDKRNAS